MFLQLHRTKWQTILAEIAAHDGFDKASQKIQDALNADDGELVRIEANPRGILEIAKRVKKTDEQLSQWMTTCAEAAMASYPNQGIKK